MFFDFCRSVVQSRGSAEKRGLVPLPGREPAVSFKFSPSTISGSKTHRCRFSSCPLRVSAADATLRAFLWHPRVCTKCRYAARRRFGAVFTRININTANVSSQQGGRLRRATSNCLAWERQMGPLWPGSCHPGTGGRRPEVTVTRGCTQLSFKGFHVVGAFGICRQCHLGLLSLSIPHKDERQAG